MNSCKKLGFSPVDLKAALTHKRVRDDFGDGERSQTELQIRQRHARSLELLANAGMSASALAITSPAMPTTSTPTHTTATLVDGPSRAEREWAALRAAGTVPGAIFHAVGAKAFNGPEVIAAAVARAKDKAAVEEAKNSEASGDFLTLQSQVNDIIGWMLDQKADYGDLSQAERRDVISYIFKAREETGFTKKTATAAASIDYLDSLAPGELDELVGRC